MHLPHSLFKNPERVHQINIVFYHNTAAIEHAVLTETEQRRLIDPKASPLASRPFALVLLFPNPKS